MIAVGAVGTGIVHIVKRDSWDTIYELAVDAAALAWSPNSRFLAASATDCTITTVFDFATPSDSSNTTPFAQSTAEEGAKSDGSDTLSTQQDQAAGGPDVVANAWTSNGRFIVVADAKGGVKAFKTANLTTYGSPVTPYAIHFPFLKVRGGSDAQNLNDGLDGTVAIAAENMAAVAGAAIDSAFGDGEALEADAPMESDGGGDDFAIGATKKRHGFADTEDGGLRSLGPIGPADDESEDGTGGLRYPGGVDGILRDAERRTRRNLGLVKQQPPFQSGSTNFDTKKPARRYLCWNELGTVSSFRGDNFIEVRFADAARGAWRETDIYGFTMAALGRAGCVFGSPFQKGAPARAGVVRFKALGEAVPFKSEDWKFDLPMEAVVADEDDNDDEDTSGMAESPVSVSIGDGWVAVATDRDLVRFVRSGGVQDALVAVPGAIITTAAHGALFAVAYHRGMPSGSRQHIGVDMFEYAAVAGAGAGAPGQPRLIASADLPLGPHTTLQWLAFSEAGLLAAHTSHGVLLALHAGLGWRWTPVCDTRGEAMKLAGGAASAHAAFWPVSMKGDTILASFTRGKGTQPIVALPPPITDILPFLAPVMMPDTPSGKVDRAFIASELSRLHRGWLATSRLSATAAYAPFVAALSAATAEVRGVDAGTSLAFLEASIVSDSNLVKAQTREADKSVLRSFINAVESGKESLAASLSGRLLIPKSFSIAEQVATERGMRGLSEFVGSLGLVLHSQTSSSEHSASPFYSVSEVKPAVYGLSRAAPRTVSLSVATVPLVPQTSALTVTAAPVTANPFAQNKRTRSAPSLDNLAASPKRR